MRCDIMLHVLDREGLSVRHLVSTGYCILACSVYFKFSLWPLPQLFVLLRCDHLFRSLSSGWSYLLRIYIDLKPSSKSLPCKSDSCPYGDVDRSLHSRLGWSYFLLLPSNWLMCPTSAYWLSGFGAPISGIGGLIPGLRQSNGHPISNVLDGMWEVYLLSVS